MDKEDISTELPETYWSIDLDWFQRNNRSISVLIWNYLCPNCAKQFSAGDKGDSPDLLMAAVRDCCSHAPGFISDRLPILESIFRFFLSNGNQPVGLRELESQLNSLRGGDSYRTSPEVLSRLLQNDCYYGLQKAGR